MTTATPPTSSPQANDYSLSATDRALLLCFAAVARTTYAASRGGREHKPRIWKLFDFSEHFVTKHANPCPFEPLGVARVADYDPHTHDAILRCEHPGHCWKLDGKYYACG
jgi:hypothetical protein